MLTTTGKGRLATNVHILSIVEVKHKLFQYSATNEDLLQSEGRARLIIATNSKCFSNWCLTHF